VNARAWLGGISLGLAIAACNGEVPTGSGSNAGTLRVDLTTPNSGADGAAVVILTGPAVPTSVTASPGLTMWGGPVAARVDTIALTGSLTAGTILTLSVGDVTLANQYSATLRQVAASDQTVALRDLTGYALAVVQ
jgi:hypothetical protein